jgi:hypothetical protein
MNLKRTVKDTQNVNVVVRLNQVRNSVMPIQQNSNFAVLDGFIAVPDPWKSNKQLGFFINFVHDTHRCFGILNRNVIKNVLKPPVGFFR